MTKCLKTAKRLVLAVCFFLWVALPHAQEIEVPINVQYVLLHKILAFDRNLKERAGKELVIGIIYQSNFRNSLNFKDELVEVIAKSQPGKLVDIPDRYVTIEWTANLNLSEFGAKNEIDIFYVAPLRAVEIKTITAVSRSRKILTFTGVPVYVDAGLAAGVGIKGDSPRIIINLPAARAEGVEFDAQLLKLAKVIE
jgi:hypothetical protein